MVDSHGKCNVKTCKFVFINSFQGEPKGGGQIIFMKSYEVISHCYPTTLVTPLFRNSSKSRLLNRLIINPLNIVINNIICRRFLKNGYEVFSETDCGTIKYVQPMAESLNPTVIDLVVWRINRALDIISRLRKCNLRLIIYNSSFTEKHYRNPSCKAMSRVLYPGIIEQQSESGLLEEKEDIIVTISRISREKNLESLSEIVKDLDYPHYIIGYCDDLNYLEFLKRNIPNSTILTNVDEETKIKLLRKSKILLHTAISEPAGIIYMEALSFGTIPIAHNSGGTREIVPEQFLYTSSEEAKDKIIKYIQSYNIQLGYELIELSRKFNFQRFKENLTSIVSDYLSNK
jgi:glycosyltransferase involved in cell wall biosynthesis